MKPGRVRYSPVCYENGGTVDDILVYMLADDKYLLVVNAGNTDKDYEWFQRHAPGDVTLETSPRPGPSLRFRGRCLRTCSTAPAARATCR